MRDTASSNESDKTHVTNDLLQCATMTSVYLPIVLAKINGSFVNI